MMAKRRERKPLADPWVIRSIALAEDMIRHVGKHPDIFPDQWYEAVDHGLWLLARTREYLAREMSAEALAHDYRTMAERYMPLIRRITHWV